MTFEIKESTMQTLSYLERGYIKKRVLFVTLDSPFLDNNLVFPYLGILYLAAVAERIGFHIKYVNNSDNLFSNEDLKESTLFYTDEFKLENIQIYKDFDLICISSFTPQSQQAYSIRRLVKEKYPQIKIVIGGPHANTYVQDCIAEGFDIICMGDGERIFEKLLVGDIKILKELLHPLSTDKTLVFYDKLSVAQMNSYPVPIRQKEYIKRYKYILRDRLATTLVNSRGCPMKCAFCEERRTGGRWHSVEHFNTEIESIVSMGFTGIMIFDDLFTVNPKKNKKYLEVLKKYHREKGLVYRCFGHASIISKFPEMIQMLSESGCVELGFGAESASQKILDVVEKGTKVKHLHDFVNYAIESEINVKAFFIIGLPGETRESFNKTYNFIKKYRKKYPDKFDFDLSVFFPYKGCKIGHIIRLPEGKSEIIEGKEYTNRSIKLRLIPGLQWEDIDKGSYGAYKKKGGDSDAIIETYDWDEEKVLLSAEEMKSLKEETMLLSGRYTDSSGNRIINPQIEGSIGSILHRGEN